MNPIITTATEADVDQLVQLDHHVPADVIRQKVIAHEILVAKYDDRVIGWLRYGYFWDSIPFMNMITVQEPYRGQGIGTQLIARWEHAMRERGMTEVWTSTYSHERAQFLYRKLGYQDFGGFILPNEPMELLLRKELTAATSAS